MSYTRGGNAVLGVHYNLSGTPLQVTIPAGAASATITLDAFSTGLKKGSETATLNLVPGSGYGLASPGSATVTINNVKQKLKRIKAPKPPTISVFRSPVTVNNRGGIATYTVSGTTINPSQPVTINYSMSGTAILGTHYILSGSPGQIMIPQGSSSGSVTLSALSTSLTSGSENATMTIVGGGGYKISKTKTATVTINNVP